jgi:hypothetical protein
VQGDILYRSATGWTALAPGSSGQVLQTQGAAANPQWFTVTGVGTVTSVATNNGLTGGTITGAGTIGLATIATGNVLAYTSGGTGVPVATAPTAVLDVIGSVQGDVLYRGVSNWSVLAPGTSGQFLQTQGPAATPQYTSITSNLTAGQGIQITGTTTATIANTAIRDYIAGLTLSNDSGSPNTVIDIAAGIATDNTNVAVISIGAFTGSIGGSWVAGTGQNKMGQGLTATASTWYHICLANNSGTADFWIDTSAVCANKPSGISDTKFRRIGSIRTDASVHIYAFTQFGNEFLWKEQFVDINATFTSGTNALYTLTTPLGVQTTAIISTFASINSGTVGQYCGIAYTAPDTGITGFFWWDIVTVTGGGGSFQAFGANRAQVRTNTSSQIRAVYSATAASCAQSEYTIGYIDYRGANN